MPRRARDRERKRKRSVGRLNKKSNAISNIVYDGDSGHCIVVTNSNTHAHTHVLNINTHRFDTMCDDDVK